MAEEPDNLVLRLLREICAKQDEHDSRFTEIDKRFTEIDKRFDEIRLYLNHTLGIGTANDLRLREHEAPLQAEEARRKRLEERWDEVERRLGKIEDKVDS
jgi:hypothetical protein